MSIRPHSIRDMIERFPYSPGTVYKAVEELEREDMVTKNRKNGKTIVVVSEGYEPQKLREIHIQSLSLGVDPDLLLRPSTVAVWNAISTPKSLEGIGKETGLSDRWIRETVKTLARHGLVRYEGRRPVVVVREEGHTLNKLLEAFTVQRKDGEVLHHSGTLPFREIVTTPEDIERTLYREIESSLTVRDTGFLIKGDGEKLTVLESVGQKPTVEDFFLIRLGTPEGVEDTCIRMIASGRLDYKRLLVLAKERNMVNVVGCYLDILNGIKQVVEPEVVGSFERSKTKRRRTFLAGERRYGKGGWEKDYEDKWNLDLYLDLGAIGHGLRSI